MASRGYYAEQHLLSCKRHCMAPTSTFCSTSEGRSPPRYGDCDFILRPFRLIGPDNPLLCPDESAIRADHGEPAFKWYIQPPNADDHHAGLGLRTRNCVVPPMRSRPGRSVVDHHRHYGNRHCDVEPGSMFDHPDFCGGSRGGPRRRYPRLTSSPNQAYNPDSPYNALGTFLFRQRRDGGILTV